MNALSEATVEVIVRSATLGLTSNSWSALVVDAGTMGETVARARDAMKECGLDPIVTPINTGLRELRTILLDSTNAAVIITADDTAGEEVWRRFDFHRTSFHHEGAKLLLLTEQAAVALMRGAVHLASWFSGAVWQASAREQVQALVNQGRVGDARRIAKSRDPNEVGSISNVIAKPIVTTRPASGTSDFSMSAKWLREHRNEHVGKWVALRGGALVGSAESRLVLEERLAEREDINDLLFVKLGK